jgi:phosphoribosyl-AMP cyclohydrolase
MKNGILCMLNFNDIKELDKKVSEDNDTKKVLKYLKLLLVVFLVMVALEYFFVDPSQNENGFMSKTIFDNLLGFIVFAYFSSTRIKAWKKGSHKLSSLFVLLLVYASFGILIAQMGNIISWLNS